MASLVASYPLANVNSDYAIYSAFFYSAKVYQTFDAPTTNFKLTTIRVPLGKQGTPTGDIYAMLYSISGTSGTNGKPQTLRAVSAPIAASSIPAGPAATFYTFTFPSGTQFGVGSHVLVIDGTSVSGSAVDFILVGTDDSSPSSSGNAGRQASGSSSWIVDSSQDIAFEIYGDVYPYTTFEASPLSGVAPLEVDFTDTSTGTPTTWAWAFGDGGSSTSQNPTHTYTVPGLYDVSLNASNANGSYNLGKNDYIDVVRPLSVDPIGPTSAMGSTPTLTTTDPPPPPPTDWSALGKEDEKEYIAKVTKKDGTYVGIWPDITNDLQFSQRLNNAGTTTVIKLGRSANTKKEVRDTRTTSALDNRVTEDGTLRAVSYLTNNTVGADTDVEVGYHVDIYVHYGEFADRVTQAGDLRITDTGDIRIVATGAPLGARIFSGYIMDYEAVYGEQAAVEITLSSHGQELSHELVRSGDVTTVGYSAASLDTIAKSILNTNPGLISYSTSSVASPGVSETLTFRMNTKQEALQSVYDQTPDGWYWYVNVADNLYYLQQVSSGYDHIFILGEHIKELRMKRSIEGIANEYRFIGGEATPGVPATTLYKVYDRPASKTAWRKGLVRVTDRRYKLEPSMQRRANKHLDRFEGPIYASTLTISSARYDIESIKLGQTVGFANFGNYIDDLEPLQIVSLTYTPTAVTVQIGESQIRQVDKVAEASESIANEQYEDIPNAPS